MLIVDYKFLQTIIECLRYATTGLPPPGTDKGKSFVYDPKLTLAGESLGQVKLRFNSTKNMIMQIKRSLRCTLQRNGKLEMKTLDTTFEYRDKHGQVRILYIDSNKRALVVLKS
jgi:DNA repair protein RAD50